MTIMKKNMYKIIVKTTSDGDIQISGEDDNIVISPDQVDTLIEWLEEAKAELSSYSDKE